MGFQYPIRDIPGTLSPLDAMLAEIALRIQLSPTDHGKAVERYKAVSEWLDRRESPLRGLVETTYPQGSMAIGATTARSSERDEHDIDAMAQLGLPRDIDPETPLSLLERSIRGERGSRYHDKTVRRTRCVTVQYEDGMHLDLTPAVIMPEQQARTSAIFHSKPGDPREPRTVLLANPWGFAEWFTAKTPAEADFADYIEQRSLEDTRLRMLAEAAAEPVPEQLPAYRKSRALVALQLIKRFRNLRYERRPNLRRPPSVLLSKYVADHANRTASLAEEVQHQASAMLAIFAAAQRAGGLVHERNPTCEADELTDRWPATAANQARFIADLRELTQKLSRLIEGTALEEMRQVLAGLFGERTARDVVAAYVERYGQQVQDGGGAHLLGAGQIPAAGRDAGDRAGSSADDASSQILRRRTEMSWLTVLEQDRRIREAFPDFRLTLNAGWMGAWQGPLMPIMRSYRIRVMYFRRRFFDSWTRRTGYATVQVVDPVIGVDPRRTGEPPPHIYFNKADPDYPSLCLHDPVERSWSPEDYIAETIIPWTSDWLFFFEGWLATGTWEGGGRHPENRTDLWRRTAASDPESRDRPDRSVADGVPQAWPKDRRFRILAIDGGGIRGIFPATFLAELERRHTGGRPIGEYFDLVSGTSTGGIIALGLAAGLTAGELQDLYVKRGPEIFPRLLRGWPGRAISQLKWPWYLGNARYYQTALRAILEEKLGERTIADAKARLCIPCFDGRHGEVYVFKTPHHPDYRTDRFDSMVRAALATAAAPAYYRPLVEGGYIFVDGGIWANNPSMLAVIEALTAFDLDRDRIDVLSLGCGNDPYQVTWWQRRLGGLFFWENRNLRGDAAAVPGGDQSGTALAGTRPGHPHRRADQRGEDRSGRLRPRDRQAGAGGARSGGQGGGEGRGNVSRRTRGALPAGADGRARRARRRSIGTGRGPRCGET